jgi:hypothetical protein
MEHRELAQARTTSVQVAKAHIPSLKSWRHQGSSPTPKDTDAVLVSKMLGSASSNTGKHWQKDSWGRRGEIPNTKSATFSSEKPETQPKGVPNQESLD